MQTRVLRIDAKAPQGQGIDEAAAVLRGGGLVAFPTETVYGLGANALDATAVKRIFTVKGRPPNNPLIVHLAGTSEVGTVVAAWPETAARLAQEFWPGPLTLVLPKAPGVPDVVAAAGPTVAVRVPAHPVALALVRAAGVPVAAPSANRSTQLSPTRAEHVLRGLDGRIDMVLDAGPTTGGLESTVLNLTTIPPRLLRPGLIDVRALEAVLGPVSVAATPPSEGALPSPGMLPRHYAPQTPLECTDEGFARVEELCRSGLRVGWLTFLPLQGLSLPGLVPMVLPAEPAGYAAQLYAVLHALDDAGVDRIVVALPPDMEEWRAVRDRLRRASS
jgi:L-threonylcarbamoyladenylate synthase